MVNFLGEGDQRVRIIEEDFFEGQDESVKPAQPDKYESHKAIAKRDPFNPAPLLDLFKKYHSEIDKMANKSMGLMVTDDASLKLAVEMTTQAKALFQKIDKQRIKEKAPYKNIVDVLDGETEALKKRTAQIELHLNGKIQPYLTKKETERKEKERLAAVEAAIVQADLDLKAAEERQKAADEARKAAKKAGLNEQEADAEAQAAAAMVEDAPVIVAQTIADETKVSTDTGTAKLKEEWTFTILNIKEIPDAAFETRKAEVIKALSPWVNNQVKAGIRNIPGVKIFKQAKISTRVSGGMF